MYSFYILDTLFRYFSFVLALLTALYLSLQRRRNVLNGNNNAVYFSLFLAIAIVYIIRQEVVFIGQMPGEHDIRMYIHAYNQVGEGIIMHDENGNIVSMEPGWYWLIKSFNSFGLDSFDFFLFVHVVYVGCQFAVCILILRGHEWIGFLFFVTAFSFMGYANNGMRNGMACSVMILAIVFLARSKIERYLSIGLMVLAISIHKSLALPGLMAILSKYIFKSTKSTLSLWVASIFLSLISGNAFGDFFADLGFDDSESYFLDVDKSGQSEIFSSTGFRWDFLLYSAMPVLLTYYLTIKRNFKDRLFNLIANTYILSNAFWILVIRANYSNRFAYLSWFLYPLVFAYPLLRFKIWDDQDSKVGLILFLYAGFTFAMYLRG